MFGAVECSLAGAVSFNGPMRPCHSNNVNLCEPYEFAVNGVGHAYDVNHAERTYSTATCEVGHELGVMWLQGGHPVTQSLPSALARVGVSSIAGPHAMVPGAPRWIAARLSPFGEGLAWSCRSGSS